MGSVLEVNQLENEFENQFKNQLADHAVIKYRGFRTKLSLFLQIQMISKGPLVSQHVHPDVKDTFNEYIVGKEVLVTPLCLIQVAGTLLK